MKHTVALVVTVLAAVSALRAQQTVLPGGVEAISLLGDSLFRPVLLPATEDRLRQQLVGAEADLANCLLGIRGGTHRISPYPPAVHLC